MKNINNYEKEFHQPQVWIGLIDFGIDQNNLNDIKITNDKNKSIFQLNWEIQLVSELLKKNSNNENFLKLNLLLNQLKNYVLNEKETNYLAVFFEALETISKYYNENEFIISKNIYILQLLNDRKNKNGLFQFQSGLARLDISIHFYSHLKN